MGQGQVIRTWGEVMREKVKDQDMQGIRAGDEGPRGVSRDDWEEGREGGNLHLPS